MNSFGIIILLTFCGLIDTGDGSGLPYNIPEPLLSKLSPDLLSKLISEYTVRRLASGKFRIQGSNQEQMLTAISLPPVINLPSLEFFIDYSFENFEIQGHFSACSPELKELDNMFDDLSIDYNLTTSTFTIDLDLVIPSVTLENEYNLQLATTMNPSSTNIMNGTGQFVAGFNNLFFQMHAKGQLPLTSGHRLSLDELNVDLGFNDFHLKFEDLKVDGEDQDLSHLGPLFKIVFDLIWTDESKMQINEMIRCAIDYTINDCLLLDLISGVYECLKTDLTESKCFGSSSKDIENGWKLLEGPGFCPPGVISTTPSLPSPTTTTITTTPTTTTPTTTPKPICPSPDALNMSSLAFNLTSEFAHHYKKQELNEYGRVLFSKSVATLIINRLQSGEFIYEEFKNGKQQDPRVSLVLPLPTPDPINLPDLQFKIELPPSEELTLNCTFSACNPQIIGLSTMTDTLLVAYDFDEKVAEINLVIEIPSVTLKDHYKLVLDMTGAEFPAGLHMNGLGNFIGGMENFFLKLHAKGKVPVQSGEFMSLDELEVDFGFEEFLFKFEDLLVNGEPNELDFFGSIIKSLFKLIWTDKTKDAINEMIRCSIDYAINDCVPLDLISGGFCLKTDLNPTCFGFEPTTTTETITTGTGSTTTGLTSTTTGTTATGSTSTTTEATTITGSTAEATTPTTKQSGSSSTSTVSSTTVTNSATYKNKMPFVGYLSITFIMMFNCILILQ